MLEQWMPQSTQTETVEGQRDGRAERALSTRVVS